MKTQKPLKQMMSTATRSVNHVALTVGDLIAAAFDTLHDGNQVKRVLCSSMLAERVNRRIVVVNA